MLLEISDVTAGYGQGDVLFGASLSVGDSDVVALLGTNGAGKSTLLKVVAGLVQPSGGRVVYEGVELIGHPPESLARAGVYLVPEGRAVFPSLTVRENLRVATGRPEAQLRRIVDDALDLFPKLRTRAGQVVGTMSGGEQQMVALARAYIAQPRLLLLDEPSLGLAPVVLDDVFAAIAAFKDAGMTIVLVEQYVRRALAVADHVVVLAKGRVTLTGRPGDLTAAEISASYLGATAPS